MGHGCWNTEKQLAVRELMSTLSQILDQNVSGSIDKGKDKLVACFSLGYQDYSTSPINLI